MHPSIGPWVPPGYLRLTDSLALQVERTVATNHARKPAFLCSGKRLAFFSAGDNFDLLVTTGKRDGMRKLGREREGDGRRSIPSAQWKKDACKSEERDERKIDSGVEKERGRGRATVRRSVGRNDPSGVEANRERCKGGEREKKSVTEGSARLNVSCCQ